MPITFPALKAKNLMGVFIWEQDQANANTTTNHRHRQRQRDKDKDRDRDKEFSQTWILLMPSTFFSLFLFFSFLSFPSLPLSTRFTETTKESIPIIKRRRSIPRISSRNSSWFELISRKSTSPPSRPFRYSLLFLFYYFLCFCTLFFEVGFFCAESGWWPYRLCYISSTASFWSSVTQRTEAIGNPKNPKLNLIGLIWFFLVF